MRLCQGLVLILASSGGLVLAGIIRGLRLNLMLSFSLESRVTLRLALVLDSRVCIESLKRAMGGFS